MRDRPRIAVVLLLATVAGFVDAAGYLLLGGVFVAHITGNASHVGQRVGVGDLHAALPAVAMIGLFVASIAAATAAMDRAPFPRPAALAAEVVLLSVLAAVPAGFWIRLALAVCAMGIQTAAVTKLGKRTIRTTYLSGMATRLAQSVVRADRAGAAIYAGLVTVFVAGAAAGAFAFTRLGVQAFGIAAAAVAVGLAIEVSSFTGSER